MIRLARTTGLVLVFVLAAAGCRSSNRLAEYDFRDRTVAVVAAIPPHPDVFTGDVLFAGGDNLLGAVVRAGSVVAKEIQAERARIRLDSAMRHVDVAARIADRVLEQGALYLRARPTDDARAADYLIDIRVREYGIEAESWDASAFFKLDADVVLIDGDGRTVWKTRVRERDAITPTMFAGATVANLLSADALARLSVDEMQVALERLADYAADRMVHRLQHDLARARR